MNDIYYQKYLKYKSKYLELQKMSGSGPGKTARANRNRQPELNNSVHIMNTYDKQDKLKEAIVTFVNTFVNPLSDEQKEELNIPAIPEIHVDLNYTDEELKDFQLFRYKIYNLLTNKIEVNLENFTKINKLSKDKIYHLFYIERVTELFNFEQDVFIRLSKLNLNSKQLKELLALNLDINDLNKFLNLNLPEDKIGCPKSNCDNSPTIINWIRSKPQNSLKNLLTYNFDTIRNSITKKDGTFLRLISIPNPEIKQ